MSTLKQRMKELSPDRRKKIETRTAQLVAKEMTLRELRQARKLTQVRMAKALRISQDGVSRLEKRTDLLLSTLRKSVEAMGGSLSLSLNFPTAIPSCSPGSPAWKRPPYRAGRVANTASRNAVFFRDGLKLPAPNISLESAMAGNQWKWRSI